MRSGTSIRIHFAILGDFADAATREVPGDAVILAAARAGIETLNVKFGPEHADRFYLFHRDRHWNAREKAWIGWERKRGKIEEFNRLLRGATDTSFTLQVGELQIDQANADQQIAQAKAEERRAMAVALEQEMRARVVEAEAEVPRAMAEAFRQGHLGIMDYYRYEEHPGGLVDARVDRRRRWGRIDPAPPVGAAALEH